MMYLAEYRRSAAMQVLIFSAVGALAVVFAFYGFRLAPFSYVFTGGAARFWFSLEELRGFLTDVAELPIVVAAVVALVVYVTMRRSRYFGNTAALLVALALAPLVTTGVVSAPWLWALPFLFTFVGGVFADVLETRHRNLFLTLTGGILAAQAVECLAALPGIVR
jgi:amino acid transporter